MGSGPFLRHRLPDRPPGGLERRQRHPQGDPKPLRLQEQPGRHPPRKGQADPGRRRRLQDQGPAGWSSRRSWSRGRSPCKALEYGRIEDAANRTVRQVVDLPGRHPHREGPGDRQARQGGEVQGPGGHPGRRGPGLLGQDRRPSGGHRLPQVQGPRNPHAVHELPMTPLDCRTASGPEAGRSAALLDEILGEIRDGMDEVEGTSESWSALVQPPDRRDQRATSSRKRESGSGRPSSC